MAPIMRLTCIVLLAAVTMNMAAATTAPEYSITGAGGEEFLIGFFEEGGSEIVMPECETTVTLDETGSVTTIKVGSETYTVVYDADGEIVGVTSVTESATTRRTQQVDVDVAARRLDACEETCADDADEACTGLVSACAGPDLSTTLGVLCNQGNIDILCSDTGLAAACGRDCATPCVPGSDDPDEQCNEPNEVCCPALLICEVPDITGACGDPHMTGFLGQKFDFTGEDGAWYCLVNDGPSMHLNMRVTAPVSSVPEITYLTGLSIITTDVQGVDHTIEISVSDPHNLDSSCPEGVSPCLADGALIVKLDGQESLVSPGEVTLGPGVAISAVNLPGACRSFGFEKYWERKKLQNAGGDRRLDLVGYMHDMGDWILADPTATNMEECTEYVAAAGETGLFKHESEHTSFQIMTPTGTIRLSHGRLHQIAMRDPADRFDLPDHLAWQMNVAIDHHDVSYEATGVIGETVVPTVDVNGNYIMKGMGAIRGSQEDYRVAAPLETVFAKGHHQ